MLYEHISTMRKNIEALLEASKESGVNAQAEKTECTVVSRHQNAGRIS